MSNEINIGENKGRFFLSNFKISPIRAGAKGPAKIKAGGIRATKVFYIAYSKYTSSMQILPYFPVISET